MSERMQVAVEGLAPEVRAGVARAMAGVLVRANRRLQQETPRRDGEERDERVQKRADGGK